MGILLRILPKNLLSTLVGYLMHVPWPRPLSTWTIYLFARAYAIDLEESEKSYREYESIGDFFIRRLKPGLRPLDESPILHPADSEIAQIGEIQEGQLIQAKGIMYSLQPLCADAEALKLFNHGLFVTYYLCPTDYHRVHSPMDGEIVKVTHIPGTLWPVNKWSTHNIPAVFTLNERVVVDIKTAYGLIKVIFVGATNVGKISLSFDSSVVSNTRGIKSIRSVQYDPPISIQKGQELGIFHMGSTVVMLYPPSIRKQRADWEETFKNKKVQMGRGLV